MNKIVDMARGHNPADFVLKNAKIINVFTGEYQDADIAILKDRIIGVGKYSGKEEIDLKGKYVTAGLIDSHLHIESSMMTPKKFAEAIIRYGITTVIADPHEIANVAGAEGIKYMISDSHNSIVDYKFMLPSCVPSTAFETSGAILDANIIKSMIQDDNILGLGEMMNYVGVINGDKDVLAKIKATKDINKIIDGHAPELSGNDLNAYINAGISTEHEASTLEEAFEKVSKGMYILIREGTAAKNLNALIPLAKTYAYRRLLFCSDDCHPYDLLNTGTINNCIKQAISNGIDPIKAISMATLNAKECYNLRDIGAIAPNYIADIVVLDDLENFIVDKVIKKGKLVVDNGKYLKESKKSAKYRLNSFNVDKITEQDISIEIKGDKVRAIGLIPNSILTDNILADKSDNDLLKSVVVERHRNTGNIGKTFVKGYGIINGAVATSIAHDSHNIIAIGDNDKDIVIAVNEIIRAKGGICVVNNGEVWDTLELDIAGLMTDKSVSEVNEKYEKLVEKAREMGVKEGIHPFMTLSFIALPVIPHLKITDKGLFDVDKFSFVSIDNNE